MKEIKLSNKLKKSTQRQREAVRFCEEILGVIFEDNIGSSTDCSDFLSMYLDDAKKEYERAQCEYGEFD